MERKVFSIQIQRKKPFENRIIQYEAMKKYVLRSYPEHNSICSTNTL